MIPLSAPNHILSLLLQSATEVVTIYKKIMDDLLKSSETVGETNILSYYLDGGLCFDIFGAFERDMRLSNGAMVPSYAQELDDRNFRGFPI